MFNLKLQNIHFTDCVIKIVPGYMAFQGHLWVMQMRMPTDSPENYSQSSRVVAGVSARCLQQVCCTALLNIYPWLWPTLHFFWQMGWISGWKSWIWAPCPVIRRLQNFIHSCLHAVQKGRHFRLRGCNSANILYFWVIRPACSWHALVIQLKRHLPKCTY